MRATKEVLHKLQFFVELLYDGVCGAEFVEQSQTPSKYASSVADISSHPQENNKEVVVEKKTKQKHNLKGH